MCNNNTLTRHQAEQLAGFITEVRPDWEPADVLASMRPLAGAAGSLEVAAALVTAANTPTCTPADALKPLLRNRVRPRPSLDTKLDEMGAFGLLERRAIADATVGGMLRRPAGWKFNKETFDEYGAVKFDGPQMEDMQKLPGMWADWTPGVWPDGIQIAVDAVQTNEDYTLQDIKAFAGRLNTFIAEIDAAVAKSGEWVA